MHAMGGEPLGVALVPGRLRAGGADIAQVGAGFLQETTDDELGAFVAGERDAGVDG